MKTLCFAFLLGAIGCTGGDEDNSKELSSGTYDMSDLQVQADECDIVPPVAGTVVITVDGDLVSIGDWVELTVNGSSLDGGGSGPFNLAPDFDCILNYDVAASGAITGHNEFDLSETVGLSVTSGTECGTVGPTFPCTTEFSYHAKK